MIRFSDFVVPGLALVVVLVLMSLSGNGAAAEDGEPLSVRVVVPALAGDGAAPQAALPPTHVDHGGVDALFLASGGVTTNPVVERRHVDYLSSGAVLQTPTHPSRIAWYDRYSQPGNARENTIFSAHVDYVGYGLGPFHGVLESEHGSSLYLTMEDGSQFAYTVVSVKVIDLDDLDMQEVIFPILDEHTERVTLITCGGTFVPNPSGIGGFYNSRVILIAERWVP